VIKRERIRSYCCGCRYFLRCADGIGLPPRIQLLPGAPGAINLPVYLPVADHRNRLVRFVRAAPGKEEPSIRLTGKLLPMVRDCGCGRRTDTFFTSYRSGANGPTGSGTVAGLPSGQRRPGGHTPGVGHCRRCFSIPLECVGAARRPSSTHIQRVGISPVVVPIPPLGAIDAQGSRRLEKTSLISISLS